MSNNEAVAALMLEIFDRGLSLLERYRQVYRDAEAQGRSVNMDDVRVLQAHLKQNQTELDQLIAAMPEPSND